MNNPLPVQPDNKSNSFLPHTSSSYPSTISTALDTPLEPLTTHSSHTLISPNGNIPSSPIRVSSSKLCPTLQHPLASQQLRDILIATHLNQQTNPCTSNPFNSNLAKYTSYAQLLQSASSSSSTSNVNPSSSTPLMSKSIHSVIPNPNTYKSHSSIGNCILYLFNFIYS